LIELDVNPEWKRRCQKEARDLIIKHVGPNASDLPVHEQIASLPMDALEEEMPILDACVREAMRVHFTLTALRRNINDDLRVGDKVIEKGAFIAYNVTDANLDSRIYPQPETFDPDRFLVRHEDSKSQRPHPYVVWGAGEAFHQIIIQYVVV
jgi:sterol 14-demethylase